ncbi:hypothetical protein [Breznakiella homolactica]|uniref:SMODS-associating 2TM beta-strand rich effector domain-containing protein n=1 Tax=Breznakiella homolactica TaxID=2798577 RepID=A0A7T7XJH7_9SPIR|nr:hypothetical protein [Breznakiella homolactica]QQO07574.1 hypothetical protein JFL75_11515 [Breznakiella homolactica]
MHEYSTDNRKRERVIFWLAMASIIITPGINWIISKFTNLFRNYIEITYTVTSVLIFTILYFFFNKIVWRFCYKFLKIPNLNGIWKCKGHSFNYKTDEEYDWDSEICIKQEWDKIGITQKTADSDSFSTSIIGGLKIEDNDEILLSYVYSNTPRSHTPNLLRHEGLVKLRFNKNLCTASGDYFNDPSRNTYGTMSLEKKDGNKK